MTYAEAGDRLGVTPEAARRRAIRAKWARMPGNDGRTRVQVPDELHPQRTPVVRPDTESSLVSALKEHVATLKTDNDQLRTQLAFAETRADKAIADMSAERAARQADQARAAECETELAVARERVAHLTADLVDERDRGVRRAAEEHAAQIAQRDEQLAAARLAADNGTAELVALAQRLAALAEERALSPELRRGRLGRAWAWFLRN